MFFPVVSTFNHFSGYFQLLPCILADDLEQLSSRSVSASYRKSYEACRSCLSIPKEFYVLCPHRREYQCRAQHQFVTVSAFYPILLTVYYPVSSAYIITLSGVKHSWRHYCFHNAQSLRSTVQAVCLLPRYWTEKLFYCLIWISMIS